MTMTPRIRRSLQASALLLLLVAAAWAGAASAAAPPPAESVQPSDGDGEATGQAQVVGRGAAIFAADFTPEQGLGPLYNARSCVACHDTPAAGGMGADGLGVVLRVG